MVMGMLVLLGLLITGAGIFSRLLLKQVFNQQLIELPDDSLNNVVKTEYPNIFRNGEV